MSKVNRIWISEGNRKMGGIPNISLPPVISCRNHLYCARKCYALKSYRQFPAVRRQWGDNLQAVQSNMVQYFADIDHWAMGTKSPFFRWHVSGDILDQNYLSCMSLIAIAHANVKWLVFTKMFGLDYSHVPDNLSVIFSLWPGMPKPWRPEGVRFAWCQDGTEKRVPKNALSCPGNCETCGMCFNLNKLGKDVVFDIH